MDIGNTKVWRDRLEAERQASQQRLRKGGEPKLYQQWQHTLNALSAALYILDDRERD
ncbi:hypothetical protein HAV28_16500 [Pseudomonas plecoglossicida]|nr:hypothetical protein HAV28_16500 [Pseudomonas plecoglossicida]